MLDNICIAVWPKFRQLFGQSLDSCLAEVQTKAVLTGAGKEERPT